MIEILVSENKSWDPVRFYRNRVRVFLNRDYNYGVWIDEDRLFDSLDTDQKKAYLTAPQGQTLSLSVPPKVAQRIVELGHTIDSKQRILRQIDNLVVP